VDIDLPSKKVTVRGNVTPEAVKDKVITVGCVLMAPGEQHRGRVPRRIRCTCCTADAVKKKAQPDGGNPLLCRWPRQACQQSFGHEGVHAAARRWTQAAVSQQHGGVGGQGATSTGVSAVGASLVIAYGFLSPQFSLSNSHLVSNKLDVVTS
jgi:hypothetical protein